MKPIGEILNDTLSEVLNTRSAGELELEGEYLLPQFFSKIGRLDKVLVREFFEILTKKIPLISEVLLKSGHEFWNFSSLMFPGIENLPNDSEEFF